MIKNKLFLIFAVLFSIFISSISISCKSLEKTDVANADANIKSSYADELYVDDDYSNIPKGISISCAETIGINAFYKIQDAIDHALPGTTIHIAPGSYNEIVTVSKSLDIMGINKKGAVIKGGLNVTDKSSKVNIYNIEITNSSLSSNNIGIYNNGILGIYNCLITTNKYSEKVAGIFNDNGALSINNSTISSNINESGVGAIFNLNGTLSISYSKIYGNISNEDNVDFYSNVEVDAMYNWWGDSTGPYHLELNPDGNGDSISENINFIPWYIDEDFNLASSL